ncbi:MAG: tetratricopeptide repeat protein [SAR324 cluster bacterium]|uniref:Tetratricopeptide repeat protein n=1 Tax=SAR324 cluster bacterium TaxID=2024889 RepID=A0A7X9FST2_9DELT|nr:tetratricopeptide repeat protein [SAR324 cluster bacterium]
MAKRILLVTLIIFVIMGCSKKELPKPGTSVPDTKHADQDNSNAQKAEEEAPMNPNPTSVTHKETENNAKEMNAKMGDYVLIYLGYKYGKSPINRLCGEDLKNAGAMPSGVSLDSGTGIMTSFCKNKVTVIGKAGGEMQIFFKDAATVELDNGQIWIFGKEGWSQQTSSVKDMSVRSPSEDDKKAAQETFETGFRSFQGNEYDKALEAFEKAVGLDPGHIHALFFKAVIYDRRKEYAKSLEAYDAFLKAKPDEPTGWSNRATALYHIGQWSEALESVEKAVQLSNDPGGLHNKGNLLFMMAEYEKAIPLLEQAKKGGAKISDVLLSAQKDIARQFTEKNLPPEGWAPNYSKYLNIGELSDTKKDIPLPPDSGNRFSFKGSEEQPFHLFTNLDVWEGAIDNDPERGFLLSSGTKFKQTRLKDGRRISVVGHIEKWKAIVDKETAIVNPGGN